MWNLLAILALQNQRRIDNDANRPLNENESMIIGFIAALLGLFFKYMIVVSAVTFMAGEYGRIGFYGALVAILAYIGFRFHRFGLTKKWSNCFVGRTGDATHFIATWAMIITAMFNFYLSPWTGLNRIDDMKRIDDLLAYLLKAGIDFIFMLPYFLVILFVVPFFEYIYKKVKNQHGYDFYVPYRNWQTTVFIVWTVITIPRLFILGFIQL